MSNFVQRRITLTHVHIHQVVFAKYRPVYRLRDVYTFRITATWGIKNGAAQWWRSHSTVRRRRCLCADVPISPISSPHA